MVSQLWLNCHSIAAKNLPPFGASVLKPIIAFDCIQLVRFALVSGGRFSFVLLEERQTVSSQSLASLQLDTYHVFTCASVILRPLASEARSAEARYFCLWKRRSSSVICWRVKEVRGFLRLGGVLFW